MIVPAIIEGDLSREERNNVEREGERRGRHDKENKEVKN